MPETSRSDVVRRVRHGSSIGQPVSRRDGHLKVTGNARFAADNHPDGMLHAALAVSGIARGRVTNLDVAAAENHPGVVAVMVPSNAPALAKSPDAKESMIDRRLDLLQNDGVRYAHQPIAVVIAESLEAATEGVALLRPRYEEASDINVALSGEPFVPKAIGPGYPPQAGIGDTREGLAAADQSIDVVYETAPQYHNALEPHAIVAQWDGDRLILDTPSQAMAIAKERIAGLLGMNPNDILIRSPFLGGGFGSKGHFSGPQMLGIMAAKLVGRPVKLVLRREQMFGPVGHRAATRQTVRLGADTSGALTAIDHHTLTSSSTYDDFFEAAGVITRHLYASPTIATTHEAVRIDTGTPLFMRAPGEGPGSLALESAMDELAYKCGMDPMAFRLKNYADVEPITGKPYSSKALRECYDRGAAAFGWANRPMEPRQMRDSEGLLVGWGIGSATYPALMFQAQAKATMRADGSARVAIGSHDMGQGAWTSLAQIAAESLGVDYDTLDFAIGTSDLPNGGMNAGSWGTATAGTAIFNAARDVVRQLTELATKDEKSPLFGAGNADMTLLDGKLVRQDDESRGESVTAILGRAGLESVDGTGSGAGDPAVTQAYAMHSHGAVFAEVKVDPDLGQIRTTRLVGAFAAGRIVNPKLVESQLKGGMIWGVSFALHEHAALDPRSGRPMNPNLAEYHVPVCADVPSIQSILVEEHDPHINPLGIKGVGEIGVTGTAGAIANAIWHATGVRVRDMPITLDRLLS